MYKCKTSIQVLRSPSEAAESLRTLDIPYRSLRTIEDKIVRACFPEGCKVIDLTSKKDGNQKVIHINTMYYACTNLVFVLYFDAVHACTS